MKKSIEDCYRCADDFFNNLDDDIDVEIPEAVKEKLQECFMEHIEKEAADDC